MCTKLFSNFSKRTMSQIPQEQHEQNSMMDSDIEADTKEKKKTFCKRNLKKVLFVFMLTIFMSTLLLCLMLIAVPKITVEKPEKNKNVSIPEETKGIKFSDLSNKITIPQTSGCLTIQATITTKNSTLVHVHGTVNDGDYSGNYSCNGSCPIKMRFGENLIGGKAITVKVKPKGVIVSLRGIMYFKHGSCNGEDNILENYKEEKRSGKEPKVKQRL